MIIRGDFILLNPENLILPIGHLGAKVVLYYLNLESQLHYQRQKDSRFQSNLEDKCNEIKGTTGCMKECVGGAQE
jgi:hypothetical protein